MPPFRLLTLGAPLLVGAAGEPVRYRTRKHFALLIRLALEPGRKLARDHLIDLLWPDVPGVRGRHSLSQAVSVLRATIGRPWLVAQRATLSLLDGAVDVDAHRLETCEAEIRGRFLEGFELRGARGFEEWRDGWAARLYPRIRDCLVKQMDAGRRIGDFATVEKHALVLEDLDPLSEDAVRGIIEARAWVGDRSNALKAFGRFATRLAEELGAKPSPELVRIVDLLREGRRAAPRPTDSGVPPREERRFEAETIIGREREFSVLYDAWLAVRRRQPRIRVVLGDPGIGKTTLANAFVSSCQMEGAIVARAQAYDAERELPYAVLAELARQLTLQRAIGAAEPEALADLSRLVPEVFSVFPGVQKPVEWPPEVVPLRLADAFLKAVGAAAEDNPVVLVVDDVHAADNASVAILHMLARKVAGLRLLLIMTARNGDARTSTAARALITDAGIDALASLELEPLSHESAQVLVTRLSAKGVERWGEPPVERIVRAGGGHPLALELLSQEWVESGSDSVVGHLDSLHTLPAGLASIPRAIRAMVERQTEQLQDRTRAVLDLASVLGRRMGDLWLYHVIGCSEAEALYQLMQLLETRLLRDVAGHLEFRNEMVRAHAYHEIPSTVRLALHQRIAHELENRGSVDHENDLEIARHYLLGRDPKRAMNPAMTGADRSLRAGAAREAELILRQLLREEVDHDGTRRCHLLLAAALMSQSKAEEAFRYLEESLSNADSPAHEAAQAARMYAQAMYLLSRDMGTKHNDMARRAVQVARQCQDRELLAYALFESARAGAESGNIEVVQRARLELHDLTVTTTIEPPPISYYAQAYCDYQLLDVNAALTAARRALEGLLKQGRIGDIALAYTAIGNCIAALCRFDEARSAYRRALELSKRMGDDCRTSILWANICATHLMAGEVEQAIGLGEESLRVALAAPAQPALVNTLSHLALGYALRGRVTDVAGCLASLRRWMREGRTWAQRVECFTAAAEIELTLGNSTEALMLIAEAQQEIGNRRHVSVGQGAVDRLLIMLVHHQEGPESANTLAAELLNKYRGRHLMAHLEVVSGAAWAERSLLGSYSKQMEDELRLFEIHGVRGKRAIIAAQGFLDPDPSFPHPVLGETS